MQTHEELSVCVCEKLPPLRGIETRGIRSDLPSALSDVCIHISVIYFAYFDSAEASEYEMTSHIQYKPLES